MVKATAPATVQEGERLWTPGPERIERSRLTAFMHWLARERGLAFDDYEALWRWSVQDLEGFWRAIWDYFQVQSTTRFQRVLDDRPMPGARWFPGARLNYAQHALRHEHTRDPEAPALLYASERTPLCALSWRELAAQVRVLAAALRAQGVGPGDRVAAFLPNIPEAIVALLAASSIGAIWSSCGPDFGIRGVLDRFGQLAPKVLFCVDGYHYGGKAHDRGAEVRQIANQIPSLQRVVYLPYLHAGGGPRADDRGGFTPRTLLWSELLAGPAVPPEGFEFEQLAFEHPLWILFSSGTTGLPKPICHSHGGIILEQLKHLAFNFDLHPGERLLVYTTTGWMMWNLLASALLSDVVPILYDGHPSWPGPEALWALLDQSGAQVLATSPSYVNAIARSGFVPQDHFRLAALNSISLAGSPVTPECMAWLYANVKPDLWVASGSGGTDVCTGFVSGVPILPVHAGEIQARALGAAVYAYNPRGEPVVDEVGELVVTRPMPSMPVCFWNDVDNQRYLESYFQEYPGVWRHGDFIRINARGGCLVLGRSDATLNRHGIRIGTAEIYRSLALLPEIEDALIVNLDLPGGGFFMPLFVRLKDGVTLDEPLQLKIRATLRREYSPRHVPDRIYPVASIPTTLTGKKMEVPVRRLLMGVPLEAAVNRATLADPASIDYFVDYARTQRDYSLR
jgi:acetoacetyl-CoA synthetase